MGDSGRFFFVVTFDFCCLSLFPCRGFTTGPCADGGLCCFSKSLPPGARPLRGFGRNNSPRGPVGGRDLVPAEGTGHRRVAHLQNNHGAPLILGTSQVFKKFPTFSPSKTPWIAAPEFCNNNAKNQKCSETSFPAFRFWMERSAKRRGNGDAAFLRTRHPRQQRSKSGSEPAELHDSLGSTTLVTGARRSEPKNVQSGLGTWHVGEIHACGQWREGPRVPHKCMACGTVVGYGHTRQKAPDPIRTQKLSW